MVFITQFPVPRLVGITLVSRVILSYLRMSSKKAKRQQSCPGCHLEKSAHHFGPLSKYCEGPDDEQDPQQKCKDEPLASSTASDILLAIRALADQVSTLSLEQQALKAQVEMPASGGQTLPGPSYKTSSESTLQRRGGTHQQSPSTPGTARKYT